MKETGPAPSSPKTPFYGYATTAAREAGIFNEELRLQAEVMEAASDRLGIALLQVVSEREPYNGQGLGRPGLEYALRRISAGEADGLMVCDLPRLTRSAAQLGTILEWFVNREARLVSVAEEIDTAERSGLVATRTLIEFSNRERKRVTDRTRPGLQVARRNTGPRPRPAVTDDPDLRERIHQMREQRMSLQAIADRLNADGVPTVRGGTKWRPSSLQSATGYIRRKPDLAFLLGEEEPHGDQPFCTSP